MNESTQTTQPTTNTDELAASIQSMVRGTDTNGNYTFMPYSPKAPVTAQEGYRVAKVMYKTNKTTNTIAGENSCLIVPKITEDIVVDNIERLISHVITMLETEQDKIVKGYHLDSVTFVEPEKLSVDAIIEAMEAIAVSGRINKEMIEAWFTESMIEPLTALLTGKGTATDKLPLIVQAYSGLFGKMASNTTQYPPEQAEKLLAAINKCEASETDIGKKLVTKLDKMMNPATQAELLEAL